MLIVVSRALFFLLLCVCFSLAILKLTCCTSMPLAKPGCNTTCGNLTVPYPFGIGLDGKCALSTYYIINCNNSYYNPPKAFTGNVEVMNISLISGQLRIAPQVAASHFQREGVFTNGRRWLTLGVYPFVFSNTVNKLFVIGCDDYGYFEGLYNLNFTTGCTVGCFKTSDVVNRSCSGIGCCQTSIPKGIKSFAIELRSFKNHTNVSNFNPYSYAFLGEQDKFNFDVSDLNNPAFYNQTITHIPIVIDWFIGEGQTCKQAKQNMSSYACQNNTNYIDYDGATQGYRCSCLPGYEGNPYLNPGCIGLSLGFLLLLAICWMGFSTIRRSKHIKNKEKLFEKNGGFLLKQQLNQNGESVESSKIFSEDELKVATNNYNEDRILGKGGYGTVYKGILKDGREVAIKKSKVEGQAQVQQFINEVVILTQIKHRNVVKLLGCCLETEVPLLVYEYISNGTLFDHIHGNKETTSWLTWVNCIRLATETADAVMYLHSAASIPIVHRDIKSANILLNESYTAKVSDFGASRLVPIDQVQVTTLVQGTLGYLDPEYFHTSRLTEKSDVYSFGVVLAELITRQKPLSPKRKIEERNLASYFLIALKEDRLLEIVHPQLVKEASEDQLVEMAKIIKECLNVKGEDRPTMKEVALELEGFKKHNKNLGSSNQKTEEATNFMGEQDRSSVPLGFTEEYSRQYSTEICLFSDMNHPR